MMCKCCGHPQEVADLKRRADELEQRLKEQEQRLNEPNTLARRCLELLRKLEGVL